MTREEAIKKIEDNSMDCDFNEVPVVESDVAINTIIKLSNDFESRTCENCKYSIAEDGYHEDVYRCEKMKGNSYFNNFFDKDFGCNKFENKD